MTVLTGSFAKSTAAAPVAQVVACPGITPKVLFLWTVGATAADTQTDSYRFGFGCATAASNAGSIAASSDDNLDTSNTASRTAAKALTICDGDGTVLAECDLTSFALGSFTITWTTNNASAYIVHFAVLGGLEVNNAQVLGWNFPTTATGTTSVTGLTDNWTPNVVLHFWAWPTSANSSAANANIGFGAMTAADQWAWGTLATDAQSTSQALRVWSGTSCIQMLTTGGGVDFSAAYSSMDAGGFTVDFTSAGAGDDHYCYSLCLNLDNAAAGNFQTENTAGAGTQTVSGEAFLPGLVLLFSPDTNSTSAAFDSYVLIGAGDGTNNQCATLFDDGSVGTTQTWGISRVNAALDRYSSGASRTATISSMAADGFVTSWSDETGGIRIGWLMLTGYEAPVTIVQGPRIIWI